MSDGFKQSPYMGRNAGRTIRASSLNHQGIDACALVPKHHSSVEQYWRIVKVLEKAKGH